MRRVIARTTAALVLLAVAAAALTVACSDDDKHSGAEVDRAYIRSWCLALQGFRDDILGSDKQQTPYPVRNIAANKRFLDTMSRATPPDDTKAWHDEWIAAGRANLAKLQANDPSAAPDPMDIGPDKPLPDRLVALFSEVPECKAVSQPPPQPSP